MYNFVVLPWSIPAKKALKSLPFYLLIPIVLWFLYTLIIDPSWRGNSAQYIGLLRIMLFIWILRTTLRFALFSFVRKRTYRF